MMQKDEVDLLDAWFKYHGYLFGFENLSVIDNGSTDPSVISTLRRYEEAGSIIHWEYQTSENFERKGDLAKALIERFDAQGGYDLAFPLDCDEFVCAMIGSGLTVERDKIHAYLDSISHYRVAHLVTNGLQNVPNKPGWFKAGNIPKGFFSSGTINTLDNGFHDPRTHTDGKRHNSSIAYLHLHNRSLAKVRHHAAQKLKHRTDLLDLERLRSYQGPGEHLTKYFFMTEDQYVQQYDGDNCIFFPAILKMFAALSIDVNLTMGDLSNIPEIRKDGRKCIIRVKGHENPSIVELDLQAYALRNRDVPYFGALYHFTTWGYQEGRTP